MQRFSMFRAIASAFILSLMFTAVSCSKEGDAGPAGPAGPAGAAGTQGPKGDKGNANIIASDWVNVAFEDDTTRWVGGIEAPEITPEILTTGEVHVYMNLNNATDPVVVPLPYFDGSFIINLQLLTGGIGLIANEDLSSYEDEDGVAYQQARYVIIPADAAARKTAGIDWNDYKQVKKYLNLKD